MKKLLEELFANYYRDVYRYLYSLCRDASLAEDLASDVFLEAVGSIVSFRRQSDVKTWLFSIARHRWFAFLRKKGKSIHTEEYPLHLPSRTPTPETLYYSREVAERIRQLLEDEQEGARNVFLLRMEGYSFREIGKQIGVSENSARVMEFRLRNKLRRILEEEGFEWPI